jgi:hypothetical protein
MYGPPPLELSIADAESTSKQLANEMLALSKLNWNNTRFDGGQPITVRAARRVCCTSITSRSVGARLAALQSIRTTSTEDIVRHGLEALSIRFRPAPLTRDCACLTATRILSYEIGDAIRGRKP